MPSDLTLIVIVFASTRVSVRFGDLGITAVLSPYMMTLRSRGSMNVVSATVRSSGEGGQRGVGGGGIHSISSFLIECSCLAPYFLIDLDEVWYEVINAL